ncbi:MAG TPA: TIGR03435 family protein [Bryobacteraceae bacterium]|jgi:uncharacterized protein (TIGR03435 family)
MRSATVLALILPFLASNSALSQTPVQFDVASVRPHASADEEFISPQFLPNGRFVSKGSLFAVIAAAYDLLPNRGSRLTGGPDWLRTRGGALDIQAIASLPLDLPAPERNARMRLMLQALLADRFKLKLRTEAKEMPIYALVVAKGGPKLQAADIAEKDCPEGPFLTAPETPSTACHSFRGGQVRTIHARAVTTTDIVSYVQNWTDRPFVDKTGLTGLYRIDTPVWQPMDLSSAPPAAADLPTIYEVFEKLGLKLESQKDKVESYVIDHIEKPSAN